MCYVQTLATSFQFKKIKALQIAILILGHFPVLAQVDSLGLDNNALLTKSEAHYFNERFKTERAEFNFHNKHILFITGSSGSRTMTKQEYFSHVKQWKIDGSQIATSLVILTEKEKDYAGLDAIVTAWVKVLTDKRRKKIVSVQVSRLSNTRPTIAE